MTYQNRTRGKIIIFSRCKLARLTEPNLKLYDETLKVYPQEKFVGINFDSQLSFQKHFEDILDRRNTKYHRLKLLINQEWGPSSSTVIQIYKESVRPIFEYGSLSTITDSYRLPSIYQITFVQIDHLIRLPFHT